jgi:hypothetical protein
MVPPLFITKAAGDVDPARDVVLCLPYTVPNPRFPGTHRIPIRSPWNEGGSALRYVPNSRSVVVANAVYGLRRFVVMFPEGLCHGIRCFDGGDRSNVLVSFTVVDPRRGAGGGSAAADRMDELARFLADTCRGCSDLGTLLPPPAPAPEGLVVIVRPPTGADGARYCSAKVVTAASGAPVAMQTKWFGPNGAPVPFATVRGWQNFRVVPYVETEEIYVGNGRCALQLKLRECTVFPPSETPRAPPPSLPGATGRPSVAFPGQRCDRATIAAAADGIVAPAADAEGEEGEERTGKRPRTVR